MTAAPKKQPLDLPARRMTPWGMVAIFWHVGVPLLLFLLMLDTALYFFFTTVLHRCYGIFCLLE